MVFHLGYELREENSRSLDCDEVPTEGRLGEERGIWDELWLEKTREKASGNSKKAVLWGQSCLQTPESYLSFPKVFISLKWENTHNTVWQELQLASRPLPNLYFFACNVKTESHPMFFWRKMHKCSWSPQIHQQGAPQKNKETKCSLFPRILTSVQWRRHIRHIQSLE